MTRIRLTTLVPVAFIAIAPFTLVHAASLSGATDLGISVNAGGANATGSAAIDVTPIVVTQSAIAVSAGSPQTNAAAATTATATGTDAVLRAHAEADASADPHISSIELSSQDVSLSYREPAQLFGFIGVDVPVHISVDAAGDTAITYPWYSFLLSTDQVGLAIRAEAATAYFASSTDTAGASTSLSATAQESLLDSLITVMQTEAVASSSAQ